MSAIPITFVGSVRSVRPARPARRRNCVFRLLRRAAVLIPVAAFLLLAAWLALRLVPLPDGLFKPPPPQLEFLDRNGLPLRVARPGDGPFSRRISYSEIPQTLVQATLAAEDRRFWDHPGVDWRASLRAACQWVVHRRVVSGGSTITQQLIKLAETRPRCLRTKIIEAIQALRLEQLWDKQTILAEYLNRLDYGNFNTGCAAAAQFYFHKPLGDLSTAEYALLAALPQAPTRLNPHSHADRALKRQLWILGQMRRAGWVNESEFARAALEPTRLAKPRRVFEAPHLVDLILRGVGSSGRQPLPGPEPGAGTKAARSAAARSAVVRTSIDLDLNHFAEQTLRHHLRPLRAQQVHNGAVVIIDNRNGEVLALVGSEDYFAPAAGQVNGAWAPRSAGSTFKPFTYLLAFERGATPASVVADVSTEFQTATGLFAPANYNRHCYGPVRYRLALANSLNISAVKVLASLGGPETLLQRLQACGVSTLEHSAESYGLGLTIGNAEARLLELANAYACLARLGEYRPYRLLLDPEPVLHPALPPSRQPSPATSRQVADHNAAYLIADILSDNAARTFAFGVETPLRFDFPVACKTGTSSDFRDNWAFGYTPEFTVGVWVGNFDGKPMDDVSGVTGAAPILHDLVEHLHAQAGTSWYAQPNELVQCWIHPVTGQRLGPGASARMGPKAVRETFLASNLPPIQANPASGVVVLGSEYKDWLTSPDNSLVGQVMLADSDTPLRIVFPPAGTTFYLDPDLPQQGRRLGLKVEGSGNLEWHSDSLQLQLEGDRPIAWLAAGRHRIEVTDPRTGHRAQTWIEVLAR